MKYYITEKYDDTYTEIITDPLDDISDSITFSYNTKTGRLSDDSYVVFQAEVSWNER